LKKPSDEATLREVKQEVVSICEQFPLYDFVEA